MSETWTFHMVAEELLNVIPNLGRLMAHCAQTTGEEEATLMQVRTLFHLLDRPATVSDLAKKRKVSLQSASVHIQNLVERGWVVRLADPTDRRRSLLEVTDQGLARAQAAQGEIIEHIAGILDGLTPEELSAAQVFITALKRITTKAIGVDASSSPHNTGG